MDVIWTDDLTISEGLRRQLTGRSDGSARFFAYAGANERSANLFMGGWHGSSLHAFAAAVQSEAVYGGGEPARYVAIYHRDGEQVAEVIR